MKKRILIVCSLLLLLLMITTGCENDKGTGEFSFENVLKGIFEIKVGNSKDKKPLNEHLYSEYDRKKSNDDVLDVNERFNHHIVKYQPLVDKLWETEGFYRNGDNISPKEMMIDFHLFMEYHKDTQKRNLQFPEFIQKDLLLIEALFAKKAMDHISSQDVGEYNILRDDMVTMYQNMYREEMINILFEGHNQVNILDRIPNIVDRYDAELVNKGLKERLKEQLGIPETVISRGMGLNLVTLYSEMDDLPDGDARELAIILTMEMRISGINMRLERFFHVTNSLEGLGEELIELRKDVELIQSTGNLGWVRERMLRSLDYLEDVYLFYKGERKYTSADQIFIDLKTREDFYALGMLSTHIKEVMDKEDYWDEVEKIRKLLVEDRYEDLE